MTARDPKGAKATSLGKKLRKEMKATKFARGTVRGVGAKVRFDVHSGSATPDLLKRTFKNAFADDQLKALKALLRKATVGRPGGEAEEIDSTAHTDAGALLDAMGRAELTELYQLGIDQGDLYKRNQELDKSFLSQEEELRDQEQRVLELNAQLQVLLEADPQDADAIQELRYLLAAELYTGPSPFPEVGERLPEELVQLMGAVSTTFEGHLNLYRAARQYQKGLTRVEKQLSALQSTLASQADPALQIIGRTGLERMLGIGRDPLQEAITAVESARPDQRTAKLKLVGQQAARFLAHIQAHPAIRAADGNPFGVKVTIEKTLAPPLLRLSEATTL